MTGSIRTLLTFSLLAALGSVNVTRGAEPRWHGVFPTMVTPFTGPDGAIHVPALEAQIAYVMRHRVQGIVVLDRHGEGPYLGWDERALVLLTARRMAFPQVPIVVGIEANDLNAATQQMAQAKQFGASAVLIRFLGADPAEAHGFFHCLSEKKILPIFYDHDCRRMPVATVKHILDLPGVIGLREARPDWNETQQHLQLCQARGKVCFAGNAHEMNRFLRAGGHGLMCPEATLLPGPTEFAYRGSRHGHDEMAELSEELVQVSALVSGTTPTRAGVVRAFERVLPPTEPDDVEAEQIPGALKYGLTRVGIDTPEHTRCPPAMMLAEKSRRSVLAKLRNQQSVAPVPYSRGEQPQNWGCLLRTGGFQLAPGVSHDLLRSQGDGLWGFPIGN